MNAIKSIKRWCKRCCKFNWNDINSESQRIRFHYYLFFVVDFPRIFDCMLNFHFYFTLATPFSYPLILWSNWDALGACFKPTWDVYAITKKDSFKNSTILLSINVTAITTKSKWNYNFYGRHQRVFAPSCKIAWAITMCNTGLCLMRTLNDITIETRKIQLKNSISKRIRDIGE